jgi:hypothetical protein
MKTRTVHDLFSVERAQLSELPRWLRHFLEKVKQHQQAAKPLVLLVTEQQNGSDPLVVLRLVDLLALLRAEE